MVILLEYDKDDTQFEGLLLFNSTVIQVHFSFFYDFNMCKTPLASTWTVQDRCLNNLNSGEFILFVFAFNVTSIHLVDIH